MSDVTTTVTVQILKQTEVSLKKNGDILGLSYGEVIDRMALDYTCDIPELTATLICEEFSIMAGNQTEEQFKDSMLTIISIFARALFHDGMGQQEFVDEVRRRIQTEESN